MYPQLHLKVISSIRWPRPDPIDEAYLLLAYRSGRWGTRSPLVEEFEREFARYHDAKHGTAFASRMAGFIATFRATHDGSYLFYCARCV